MVVGSAALGVVVRLAARDRREPWWYPMVGVGALGALTTMSSFQVEDFSLWRTTRLKAAEIRARLARLRGMTSF